MRKRDLVVLIFTFIVILSWVLFDIIHSKSNVVVSSKLQQNLAPLDPTFDQTTIDLINKRLTGTEPVSLNSNVVTSSNTPSSTPVASSSAQPSPGAANGFSLLRQRQASTSGETGQ